MAESPQQPKSSATQPITPADLIQTQQRNTAVMMRANEIIATTVQAVWNSEMEFFRQEAERIAKLATPLKSDDDPTKAVFAYREQWQDSSEKLIQHMRTTNDLMLKSSWDLFDLYQQSLQNAVKPFQTRSR